MFFPVQVLHHGQLINHLLPLVESGFKNSNPEVKCAAYRSWDTLIDNFALDLGQFETSLLLPVGLYLVHST